MRKLEELIAELEKAEGPSLDLDGAIEVQVRRFEAAATGLDEMHWAKWQHYGNHVFEGGTEYDAEHFTGSLDAAVALVDRVLPGWRIRSEHGDNYSMVEFVRGWGAHKEILGIATSERPDDQIALCVCAATLRTKLAQEEA